MKCYKCDDELQKLTIDGVNFYYCEKCGGLLLNIESLIKFSTHFNLKSGVINPLELNTIPVKEQNKPCDICKIDMEKVYFNGVILDVCKKCSSIWFDEGELFKFFKLFMKNIPSNVMSNKEFIMYKEIKNQYSEKNNLSNMMDSKCKEYPVKFISGFTVIFSACLIFFTLLIVCALFPFLFTIFPFVMIAIGIIFAPGFRLLKPQEALVLTLFGKYVGTLKNEGFYYVNPLVRNVGLRPISLKTMTLQNNRQKINDELGNPIEIGIVVIWKVKDTAKAMFNVENYAEFLSVQSDSALRAIVRMYPYDTSDPLKQSLRGDSQEISEKLKNEIQNNVKNAGISVIDAKITHLAYAPEIAIAMLQRQQAAAVIDAKNAIVEGAVGTVEMALNKLSSNKTINFTPEEKAKMVNNLLVMLCSNKEAQPVIPTF